MDVTDDVRRLEREGVVLLFREAPKPKYLATVFHILTFRAEDGEAGIVGNDDGSDGPLLAWLCFRRAAIALSAALFCPGWLLRVKVFFESFDGTGRRAA